MATIDLGKIKQVWRGTYNNGTAYTVDDLVEYTDSNITSTYICVANSTGNAPSSSGTAHASWNYVAKGVVDPIPSQSGNTGKFLKTDGTNLSFDQAGKLLSINQSVKTGMQTIASSAWIDIHQMSVTVTPQLSNSKFLIQVRGFGAPVGGVYFMANKLVKVVGGSTSDFADMSGANGNRFGSHCTIGTSNAQYSGVPVYAISFDVIHQVSSTAAITFKVQSKQGYGGNHAIYWNSSDRVYTHNSSECGISTSTITVTEYTS